MKKTILLISLLFIGGYFAQSKAADLEEVDVEDVSTSGNSIVINRGLVDKFEEGIIARFYLQKGPKEFPKIFLVAEGELIKSFPKKSYWILKKKHIPEGLKRNISMLIATSDNLLAGRSMRVKNHHVVIPQNEMNDLDSYIDKNKDNVPARLVKEGSAYEASAEVFEDEEFEKFSKEADLLVTTYEGYKTTSGTQVSDDYGDVIQQKYFLGNREVKLGDIRKKEDKVLFDSLSRDYVKKTNGMKYGVQGFYSKQERLREIPELGKNGSTDSTYETVRATQKEADVVDKRAIAKYKRDGDQWSSDMDDKSLRKYFVQTGLEKEARRRELALNELDGHEIVLHYSNAITSHSNYKDPNNQGRGYSLGLSYDLHLSRTSEKLKQWSIQFILEAGVVDLSTGLYNARSEEVMYGGYLNYYFINNPLTLNKFIWLGGVGLKNGTATLTNSIFSKEYTYQVLTLPAFQLMTKYRFRPGDLQEDSVNMGASLNFGLNYEFKNLSLIDKIEDDIDSKFSMKDLKYTIGMSVYF